VSFKGKHPYASCDAFFFMQEISDKLRARLTAVARLFEMQIHLENF
jgi:hypothetical protein